MIDFTELVKNANTFDDIYLVTDSLTKQEKGYFFEILTYYVFLLVPERSNGLQNIWLVNESVTGEKCLPEKVRKFLDLEKQDRGIDLVALIDNEYYAIQSKFRQNCDYVINWKELATFFGASFGINNGFKHGFFVTNTFDLCLEALKTTKVTTIGGKFFDGLDKIFFDNLRQKLLCNKFLPIKRRCLLRNSNRV